MISKRLIKDLSKHLPSRVQKSRIWLCSACGRRYARPRRLIRNGGLVVGECWACGKTMQRVIPPIQGNVFEGKPLIWKMFRRARKTIKR